MTTHRMTTTPLALLALVTLLVPLALALAAPQADAATSYTNPIKTEKGADPWIQYYEGNYYLITTSWTSELTMRRSPTLEGLRTAPSVQVYEETDSSRCCNMWAPEMYRLEGPDGPRWYIYYSAGEDVTDYVPTQRIHVLESTGDDPMGPYVYRGELTDPANDTWQIDGSILRLDGRMYLMGSYYGTDSQNLFIMPLIDPYTVGGPRVELARPTYDWERQGAPVLEAPEPLYHNGETFIVYSASFCNTPDYKLGLLTHNGGDPMNAASWDKSPEPVFERNDAAGVYGPAHNGFFTSPDGTESWIVYHANDAESDGCDNGRTTRAQEFTWNADGTPDFGVPVATGVSLAAPSGETAATPTGYTLVNRNSGKCLEVVDGSGADGVNVAQRACDGSAQQRWSFDDLGDDTSRIISAQSGKVLDVANCDTADGAGVRQWSWLDNTCQRFRLVTTDEGGWVRVENANSGKVLDVANCDTADGADVRQWSWLDNTCQQWRLDAVT
ncbi:family 43 glycosylhydrolase [Salinactinospora qingdaonensis]|uniref:Ricin B lectin domain-containing protein n=1 Tax=Salinactinospora qingdaonensis TaxID=702744 RepID=A0ABP7FFJ5_9ACTN